MPRPRPLLLSLAMAVLATASLQVRADEYADIDKLFGAGQWSEAVLKADQFIAAHPRDARMRFLKGLALSELGRNTDAIAVFVKLTEDFPDLPEPHNNL